MTSYNLVLLLRILKRRWVLTLFNLVVYGIGLAVCLIIGQKMSYELSYDKFYRNYKNIYRVSLDHYSQDVFQNSTATSIYAVGPELVARYPDVENMVRILHEDMGNTTIAYKDEGFSASDVFVVDTTFFKIFNLEIKYGTMESPRYKDIFISESLSNKIFGSEDPTGEVVAMHTEPWKVKGVFKDIGSNSHFKFNLLIVDRDRPYTESHWGVYEYYTYLLLNEKTDIDELEEKLKAFSSEFSKVSGKVTRTDHRWEIKLQPVDGIHLNSHLQFEHEANGDVQDIYLMVAIIIMLMIISCFNYTNLLISINEDRIKEFRVKKVFGASTFQLLKQNLLESLLFTVVAIPFAGLMIKLVFAFRWNDFGIEFYEGRNYAILLGILSAFIATHLLFPTFLIVKSITLRFLDSKNWSKDIGSGKGIFLVVPQLVISVILIAMSLTVNRQLEFLNEIDLGFSNDNVLTLSTHFPYSYAEAGLKRLENNLRQRSQIKAVSFSETIPGEKFERDGSFRFVEQPQEDSKFCYIQMVSRSYFETFQIDVLAGSSFSENRSGDSLEVVVNESMAKSLNVSYEKLIGRRASIPFENEYLTFVIVGVVKDYYHQSMRDNIVPCAYVSIEKLPGVVSSISVRTEFVDGQNRNYVVGLLRDSFKSSFPTDVANLSYAKDIYEIQFRTDYQFSKIINTTALISIVMTILGLIGLASSYIRKRTKEVAIRKVNGASIADIVLLFGVSYLKAILITFVIAFPLSIYLVRIWLQYFVVRVDLGVWFVVLPMIITIGVFILSISYYVTKVAILDPAKVLKEN